MNEEYPFIAITPRSTLIRSCSTGRVLSISQIKLFKNLTECKHHHHHHHHHVVPLARISLILSLHFSLSFIASRRSSGLHPVSSHSCCMYVRASRPAFTRPYMGVHRSTSLMSSSLLLQQCPAYLVRLTWIFNRIINIGEENLKPFNRRQRNELWLYTNDVTYKLMGYKSYL